MLISIGSRGSDVYGEGMRERLVASVDHPQFLGIRMSARSAAYVSNAINCRTRHPAETVAIVPDGLALCPLLGLSNPFRNDWWHPGEIDYLGTGPGAAMHQEDVRSTVSTLNQSNDWLILAQSAPIHSIDEIADVFRPGAPFEYFAGESVTCGTLTGKYRAPATPVN